VCLCVCDECNWPLCTLFEGILVLTKLHKWCRHKDVCDDTSEKFVSCARTQTVCGYVTNYVCDFETRPLTNLSCSNHTQVQSFKKHSTKYVPKANAKRKQQKT